MSYTVRLTGFSRCNKKGGKIAGLHWGEKLTSGQTVCVPLTVRVHLPLERAHYLLQSLEVSSSRKWNAGPLAWDFSLWGIKAFRVHTPWQIPAPGFGSSVLPPRSLSDTDSTGHLFPLNSLLRFLPLEVFCSALWPLPSSVMQCFWWDVAGRLCALPTSTVRNFSDSKGWQGPCWELWTHTVHFWVPHAPSRAASLEHTTAVPAVFFPWGIYSSPSLAQQPLQMSLCML